MKNQNRYLPLLLTLGAGAVGFVLRFSLHLGALGLTGLLAAVLAVWIFGGQGQEAPVTAVPVFRRGTFLLGFLGGCFLLAHGMSLVCWPAGGILDLIRPALALAAGLGAMARVSPLARSWGFSVACSTLVCVHFALELLCRYRGWSGNPQVEDYCFHVLACALLALSSYHTLAFAAGMGRGKRHRFLCLMAVYLCLLCIQGPEPRSYYLGGALWAVSALDVQSAPETAEEPREESGL